MTDVLETAMKYRTRLKSELSKVEDFLQMADTFSRGVDATDPVTFFTNGSDNTTVLKQPMTDRPRAAGGANGG
jgi:hypothetical protein